MITLYVISLFLVLFYLIPGEKVWLILHEYYWGLFGFLGIFVPILNIYSIRQMRKKKFAYRLGFQIALFSVTLMVFGSTVYAFGSHGIELSDYVTELVECFGKGGQHIGAGIAGGLWGVPITKIFGPTGGGIISLFIFVVLFYNCLKVLFGDVVEQFKEPVIEKITETVQMQSAVREEEQRIKAIQRKRAVEEFERRKAEKRAALEKNEQEQALTSQGRQTLSVEGRFASARIQPDRDPVQQRKSVQPMFEKSTWQNNSPANWQEERLGLTRFS